jgi:hypothetical protein
MKNVPGHDMGGPDAWFFEPATFCSESKVEPWTSKAEVRYPAPQMGLRLATSCVMAREFPAIPAQSGKVGGAV